MAGKQDLRIQDRDRDWIVDASLGLSEDQWRRVIVRLKAGATGEITAEDVEAAVDNMFGKNVIVTVRPNADGTVYVVAPSGSSHTPGRGGPPRL